MEVLNKVFDHFNKISPIPPAEWEKALSIFRPVKLQKGNFFEGQGQVAFKFAFVVKGLVREYYALNNGKEFIKNFKSEFQFPCHFRSLLLGEPSRHEVQAIEDTFLLVANYTDYKNLVDSHMCWHKIAVSVLEELLLEKENREFEFLTMQAGERYKLFIKKYAHIVDRIPQYYIASYLGIDPASLNRVIRKLAKQVGPNQSEEN